MNRKLPPERDCEVLYKHGEHADPAWIPVRYYAPIYPGESRYWGDRFGTPISLARVVDWRECQ